MRDVPEVELSAWAPPAYSVDSDGKVVGAIPGPINNWGRWGEFDQKGTTNLLTAERVAESASLVRTGKRFGLGLPVGGLASPSHRSEPLHLFQIATGDMILTGGAIDGGEDYLVMALQGTTQIDGFAHVGRGNVLYNGYWSGLVTAGTGARRLGVHHLGSGLVGRGVLLDVAAAEGVRWLEPGFPITADVLDRTAQAQGVQVRRGDILLVRTGMVTHWYERFGTAMAPFQRVGNETARHDLLDGPEAGLASDTVAWLHDHDVAVIGTDNLAVECRPAEEGHDWIDFHVAALRDLGLPLVEVLDLDELAQDCASDGLWEGQCVMSVLPVVNAVGSPLNPIFIK
jgi:kynurenine formamidase